MILNSTNFAAMEYYWPKVQLQPSLHLPSPIYSINLCPIIYCSMKTYRHVFVSFLLLLAVCSKHC